MKTEIVFAISLSATVFLFCGCTQPMSHTFIETIPEGATVEGKATTHWRLISPDLVEEDPYVHLGETPCYITYRPQAPFGSKRYLGLRISKPGFYPIERMWRSENLPDKLEFELEKIE